MRSRWYLLFVLLGMVFFSTPLFAYGIPQPGTSNPSDDGQNSTQQCYICRGSYNIETGENRVWCGKPDSGGWGMTECDVVEWDNQVHCWAFAQSCCIN
jgi:hypothetical protein